ncbi:MULTISPECIES: hypothetical protein [unclassified Legionella]|uniref:hypothetical protein n=1 Tax=unclassified Legionella TaxID=2622702 RepID=UPI001054E7F7|nr:MULTISPECIES: hypothetical protein [unclassified Legionella]MDI9818518.1 hypothetical protein [Legionella sp. PL877]
MNINEISNELVKLSPAKRVKFIRQKLLKQNQQSFCEDGIVRSGTLKSIESGRMKIGSKIAERLVHKFNLEGVICDSQIFLEKDAPCDIKIDFSKKELTGDSMSYLEEMRQKITQLTPIIISTDDYEPIFPKETTLLTHEATKENLKQFKNTLCYIKGDKSSLYYLTYMNAEELQANFNNKTITISTNMLDFCSVYVVKIIYFGNKTRL